MDNNRKKLTYEEALAEVRKNKTSSFDRALEEVRSRKSNVTPEPVKESAFAETYKNALGIIAKKAKEEQKPSQTGAPVVVEQQPVKDDNGITEVTAPDKENNIDVPAPKKPAYREWYEKVTSTPVKVKDEPTEELTKPAEEKTATIAEGAKGGENKAGNNAAVYGKFDSDGKLKLTEKGREYKITPDMPEEEAFVLATAKTDYDNLTDEEKDNYLNNPNYFKNVANFIKSGKSTKEALELAPGSIEEEIATNVLSVAETARQAGSDAFKSLLDASEEFDIWFENKVVEPSKRIFSGEATKEIREKNNISEYKIIANPIELLSLTIKQAENEDRKSDVEYKEEMTEHVEKKQGSSEANSYNNFGRGENGYYDTSATMNYSPVGRFITDASYQFGRMVPTLLAAAATQGASLPAVVPGITMFATGYTSSKANALREGASLEDAERYAHLTNLGEVFTEYLTGGILGFGKGQFDDVAFNAIAKMTTNPYVRASAMGAIKTVGGSLEEVAAGWLDVGAKKITYDPDATVDLGELGYSALLGGFMTLPGAVISGTTEYRATKQTYDMVSDIIGIASKASTPTEVANAVKFMDSVAGRAQTIAEMSDAEIAKTLGVENTPENIAAVRRDYKIIQSEMKRATQAMLENKYRIIAENAQNGVGSQNEKALLTRIVAMAKSGDINGAISLAQSEIDANNASMQELADLTSFSEDEKRALGQTLADRNAAWGEVIGSLEDGKVDALAEVIVEYSEDTANADGDISVAESTNEGEGSNYTTESANAPVGEEIAPASEDAAPSQDKSVNEDVLEKPESDESGVKNDIDNSPETEYNISEQTSDAVDLPESYKYDANGDIVFNQADIDYSNAKGRHGQFKILKSLSGNGKVETVNGMIFGKYGVYKNDVTGKYGVVLLQAGSTVKAFDALTEAKKVASYLDENLSFNSTTFKKGLSGDWYINRTDETKAYLDEVKRIIENKAYEAAKPIGEIKEGKVPFKTKSELSEYVKSHIGDKVKVTFGNGITELRTIDGISSTSLRTKTDDGSVSSAALKGIKYNGTGFVVHYDTGVTVMFDFVNVDNFKTDDIINTETTIFAEVADTKNTESKENSDGREEETVSDTKNAESTRRVGKENTAGVM